MVWGPSTIRFENSWITFNVLLRLRTAVIGNKAIRVYLHSGNPSGLDVLCHGPFPTFGATLLTKVKP